MKSDSIRLTGNLQGWLQPFWKTLLYSCSRVPGSTLEFYDSPWHSDRIKPAYTWSWYQQLSTLIAYNCQLLTYCPLLLKQRFFSIALVRLNALFHSHSFIIMFYVCACKRERTNIDNFGLRLEVLKERHLVNPKQSCKIAFELQTDFSKGLASQPDKFRSSGFSVLSRNRWTSLESWLPAKNKTHNSPRDKLFLVPGPHILFFQGG